jgi:hypothetical protein
MAIIIATPFTGCFLYSRGRTCTSISGAGWISNTQEFPKPGSSGSWNAATCRYGWFQGVIHSRQRASIIRTFLWFLINFAKAFWQTTRSLNKANSTGFGAVGAPGELLALLALAC